MDKMTCAEVAAEMFRLYGVFAAKAPTYSEDYHKKLLKGEKGKDWALTPPMWGSYRVPLVSSVLKMEDGKLYVGAAWNYSYHKVVEDFSFSMNEAERTLTFRERGYGFALGGVWRFMADKATKAATNILPSIPTVDRRPNPDRDTDGGLGWTGPRLELDLDNFLSLQEPDERLLKALAQIKQYE